MHLPCQYDRAIIMVLHSLSSAKLRASSFNYEVVTRKHTAIAKAILNKNNIPVRNLSTACLMLLAALVPVCRCPSP
jgi:hypothetical protein